jgi:hypothetical protein
MTITTIVNFAGSASARQFSSTAIFAKWIVVTNPSSLFYIGDSSINTGSPGSGLEIQAGQIFEFPKDCEKYDLSQLYFISPTGVFSIMYGS